MALAAAYAVVAVASNLVAVFTPEQNAPVWPAAGVALAALLVWGLRCWPGVLLGAFAVYFYLWFDFDTAAILESAVLASTACLQAVLGAWWAWGLVRAPLPLIWDHQIRRFLFFGGILSTLAAALAAVAALRALDLLPQLDLFRWLLTWWAGNALGVLLFTPLALILWPGTKQFRTHWGVRVAAPLLITAGLIAITNIALDRLEEAQALQSTHGLKAEAFESGFMHLPQIITLLRSVERLFAASDLVDRDEFRTFTEIVLPTPGLVTVEWLPRVTATERGRFEMRGHIDSEGDFQITEFDPTGALVRASRREEYFPGYLVEPLDGNEATIGFDFGSLPTRRAAMDRARDAGLPDAAEPVALVQTGRLGYPVFVPVYRKGFEPRFASTEERRGALTGFVLGSFDVGRLLEPMARASGSPELLYRVSDITPGYTPQVLAFNLTQDKVGTWQREVSFAGRTLRLELLSAVPYWTTGATGLSRLFYGFSVLAAFLVALAALAAAGRFAATSVEVRARTAELRESEENLAVTLHSIGDGVLATDTRGFVTRMNAVAETLTGWPLAEAQGRPVTEVFQIVNDETGEPVEVPVARVLATGETQGLANHAALVARDGTRTAIADSAAPIRDDAGSVRGAVLVFRDVEEASQSKRALEESERRYRHFIDLIPYGVFVEQDGRFAFLNPRASELLGAESASALVGRPILEFVPRGSRDAVDAWLGGLGEQTGEAAALVNSWWRLDGTIFYGEASAVPYRHEGRPGALVILQDVTERELASRQRDRFFDLSADLVCINDANGRFVRVNPKSAEILGWSGEQMRSMTCRELIHPDDLRTAERHGRRLRAGAPALKDWEARVRCRDGTYRWISWSVTFHEGQFYSVGSDATERRAYVDEITAAREAAEHADRAKSAFLATMSHEIRTPMNGVIGTVDVLSHSRLSEHQAELVRTIRSSAIALLHIIDDILDFSKIEAGRLELEREPFSLVDTVEGLCTSLAPIAARDHVDLNLFVSPELPQRIIGDETRLRQIFYNLIGNAIKFSARQTGRDGRVSVRVVPSASSRGMYECIVTDNGIGMTPDTVSNLFQAFTQGEISTTREFGGTGLGLAICKRIVDMMGGEIDVESTPGEGSRFTVKLPLESAARQPAATGAELSGLHCIVVRNDGQHSEDAGAYLEHAGATVIVLDALEDAARAAADLPKPVVVVHDIGRARETTDAVRARFDGIGDVRHLLIARGRRRSVRMHSADVVIIDGNVLGRRGLVRAAAVAAGRASPEVVRDDVDDVPAGGIRPAPSIAEARDRGELILVAEDDEINQKVIRQQLGLLGYAAEIAGDGAEALAMWRVGCYGLLVTDLHMPQMDGYDLAAAIRAREENGTRIPIVALTANALRGEETRAFAQGIDEYLIKPVSLRDLRQVLEQWLPRANDEPGDSPMTQADKESGDSDAVAIFDPARLASLVGDDPATVQELLQEFRATTAELRRKLHQAADAGELDVIAGLAHRLKSTSYSVGAMKLGALCARMEADGKSGDASAVADSMPVFEQALDEADGRIREHLDRATS